MGRGEGFKAYKFFAGKMTKVLICGCNGKMGKAVVSAVNNAEECEVAAGVDVNEQANASFPVYLSMDKIDVNLDVIIDFSHPSALTSILNYARKNLTPVVLCTTGYDKNQVKEIKEAAEVVPIFSSRNMSLGINLLIELSKKAASVLGDKFDIEIIEKHHNQKIDAPSGTALMIANALSDIRDDSMQYVYDRHSYRKPREKSEIGIHTVRGGNIVGDHEVLFAGTDEVLTISHQAQSKGVFAVGAVKAAQFLIGKEPRIYDMGDLIK